MSESSQLEPIQITESRGIVELADVDDVELTFEDVDLPDLFHEVASPAPNPHGTKDRHVYGFGSFEIPRHGSAGQDITPVPVGIANLVNEVAAQGLPGGCPPWSGSLDRDHGAQQR